MQQYCLRGHNTLELGGRTPGGACRQCARARSLAWYEKNHVYAEHGYIIDRSQHVEYGMTQEAMDLLERSKGEK